MSLGTVVTAVVLCTICAATALSNLMVFVAVCYSRRLRSVSNVFIVSLSMSDILLATVVMVPATLNQVRGTRDERVGSKFGDIGPK